MTSIGLNSDECLPYVYTRRSKNLRYKLRKQKVQASLSHTSERVALLFEKCLRSASLLKNEDFEKTRPNVNIGAYKVFTLSKGVSLLKKGYHVLLVPNIPSNVENVEPTNKENRISDKLNFIDFSSTYRQVALFEPFSKRTGWSAMQGP